MNTPSFVVSKKLFQTAWSNHMVILLPDHMKRVNYFISELLICMLRYHIPSCTRCSRIHFLCDTECWVITTGVGHWGGSTRDVHNLWPDTGQFILKNSRLRWSPEFINYAPFKRNVRFVYYYMLELQTETSIINSRKLPFVRSVRFAHRKHSPKTSLIIM